MTLLVTILLLFVMLSFHFLQSDVPKVGSITLHVQTYVPKVGSITLHVQTCVPKLGI